MNPDEMKKKGRMSRVYGGKDSSAKKPETPKMGKMGKMGAAGKDKKGR